MVHHGPARGCQRCKDRHVKCDLERPACRQCLKLRLSCPGYGHSLDVVLRDQTTSVIRRHGYQRHRRKSAQSSAQVSRPTRFTKSPLPRELVCGIDTVALPFLVSASGLLDDGRTSHGHLDSLRSFYSRSTPTPLFTLATSWLATLVMSLTCSTGRQQCLDKESQLMAKVIQRIRKAITDPIGSVSVETLASVVILGHGEFLRSKVLKHPSRGRPEAYMIHQAGAESLVRKRGLLNFQDSSSVALFDAVRHNAVGLARTYPTGPNAVNWDLWEVVHERFRVLCDSYTPATELDACGARIVSLKRRIHDVSIYDESVGLFRNELLVLFDRIQSWEWRIPPNWKCRLAGMAISYLSPKVHYLFNEWRLLELEASHLIKLFYTKLNGQKFCTSQYTQELNWIESVMESVHSFFGHGPVSHSNNDEHATPVVRTEFDMLQGRRLSYQSMERLEIILSDALKSLQLPELVKLRYMEIVNGVKAEKIYARNERYD